MATTYRTETIQQQVVDSVTCDRCGLVASQDAVLDAQEFMHWRHTGGYNSVFGDGSILELDLCQGCVQDLLGGYIRNVGTQW